MKIDLLTLYNYRNYNNLNLKLSSNINIFSGFNAQGKTNIIEAIYFSSLGVLSSEYPNIIPDFCEKSMNSQYTLIGDFCVIYVRK